MRENQIDFFLHFRSQCPWPLDLKFAPLVTLVQRCVSTKFEVSTAFVFRESRDTRRKDGQTDGQKDGRCAALNVAQPLGRFAQQSISEV